MFGWTESWLISTVAESPSGPAAPKSPFSRSAGLKYQLAPSPSPSSSNPNLFLPQTRALRVPPHLPSPRFARSLIPLHRRPRAAVSCLLALSPSAGDGGCFPDPAGTAPLVGSSTLHLVLRFAASFLRWHLRFLYSGTVFDRILLSAGTTSLQLAQQTRQAKHQGDHVDDLYKIVKAVRRLRELLTTKLHQAIFALKVAANMDRGDEESENSSENSFNECATAALVAAYAYQEMHMSEVPLQVTRGYRVQDISGRQWVHNLLSNPSRCFKSFRMRPENFVRLHTLLTAKYGLESRRKIDSVEALGMFPWACGTNQCQRQMEERFQRGLGTCSTIFGLVLAAIVRFANDVIRPVDYTYALLPEELVEYAPFFDGCIGAVDNTHIDVIVDEEVRDDHINRHGDTSQNVLAVCDFNMRFVYIGAGTEGSAHDMRVKKKAELNPYFPHPPPGHYYLADSGFALRPGFLTLYPRKRYWVKEFQKKGPSDEQEVFNRHHSKLRNVIERTFGAAKAKWKMLKGVPHYPGTKQTQIIIALCALHNYMHDLEGEKQPGRYRGAADLGPLGSIANLAKGDPNDMEQHRDWITYGLLLLGKTT